MNEETRHEQTLDPLSRWWWPGQWLCIVYAVWVDQVWYWQNVRPRLRDQKQAWGLLMQGILGTVFVKLVLSVMMGGVLAAAGAEIDWRDLILSATIGVAFVGVLITVVAWSIIVKSMDKLLPRSIITLGVVISLWIGGIDSRSTVVGEMVVILLLCAIYGLACGVSDVLTSGVTENYTAIERGLQAGVLVGLVSGRISQAVIAIAAASPGYYLGGRWATRQIPDEETRKRLAGADASPAES